MASSKKQKGKCFECGGKWYWCQECGAAGCASDNCSQQKQASQTSMGLFSTLRCRVCGSQ